MIALQSLGEFFNAVTRKGLLGSADAAHVLNTSREALKVVPSNEADLIAAIDLNERFGFQFFDCLLVATYIRAGCTTLISEDFQHNQTISGLTVINPFKLSEQELDLLL